MKCEFLVIESGTIDATTSDVHFRKSQPSWQRNVAFAIFSGAYLGIGLIWEIGWQIVWKSGSPIHKTSFLSFGFIFPHTVGLKRPTFCLQRGIYTHLRCWHGSPGWCAEGFGGSLWSCAWSGCVSGAKDLRSGKLKFQ